MSEVFETVGIIEFNSTNDPRNYGYWFGQKLLERKMWKNRDYKIVKLGGKRVYSLYYVPLTKECETAILSLRWDEFRYDIPAERIYTMAEFKRICEIRERLETERAQRNANG